MSSERQTSAKKGLIKQTLVIARWNLNSTAGLCIITKCSLNSAHSVTMWPDPGGLGRPSALSTLRLPCRKETPGAQGVHRGSRQAILTPSV